MITIYVNEKYNILSHENELYDRFRSKKTGEPVYIPDFFTADGDVYNRLLESDKWDKDEVPKIDSDISHLFKLFKKKEEFGVDLHPNFGDVVSYLWNEPLKIKLSLSMRCDGGGYIVGHQDVDYYGSTILYLNPFWDESWGGILQYRPDKNSEYIDTPKPNMGGTLFIKSDQPPGKSWEHWEHRVTRVVDDCPHPRLVISIRWVPA